MRKRSVCILFGGVSPEHEVSLRSAESVLNNLDPAKYNVFPVGITREGQWILFGGRDYSMLSADTWLTCPQNRPAAISPVRGQGLLSFENDCVVREHIDVVFPLLHGENGEDGSVQGLLQLAGLSFVGSGVGASSACMDKAVTKLLCAQAGILQTDWQLVTQKSWSRGAQGCMEKAERAFSYPMFVKPAGTGSSIGISKAKNREELEASILDALRFDDKVLIEAFVDGREIEVAMLGNDSPCASVCGEIEAGAEFYDYEAKYLADSASFYVPARLDSETEERVRETAVRVYETMGCRGLARVDFFVRRADDAVVFNEINTIPGFTSISMYPKLFAASGIAYPDLLDKLISLALED